jgi:hypothetical protein
VAVDFAPGRPPARWPRPCIADNGSAVRRVAVQALAAGWHDDRATLAFLVGRATIDLHWTVLQAGVQALAVGWPDSQTNLRLVTSSHSRPVRGRSTG